MSKCACIIVNNISRSRDSCLFSCRESVLLSEPPVQAGSVVDRFLPYIITCDMVGQVLTHGEWKNRRSVMLRSSCHSPHQ